jgi:hypothetical protein
MLPYIACYDIYFAKNFCTILVSYKVESTGLVSIVHNPHVITDGQEVHESVTHSNENFFKVKWDGDGFPSLDDGCGGTCTNSDEGCLCDVVVAYEINFDVFPTYDEVLSQLKIGSISLEWMSEYSMTSEQGSVQMFNKDESTELRIDTIFVVEVGGEAKSLMNSKSTVTVDDGGTQMHSFRNPPSLMSIIDQKSIGAYYETEALMDMYLNHDNTPPFIASGMIKRFVTSNPR